MLVWVLLGCATRKIDNSGYVGSQTDNDVYVKNFDALISNGAMFVKGTLVNNHGVTISNVEIEARAYDKNNKLVSTDEALLAPTDIRNKEEVDFSVTFTKNVDQIATYYLLGKFESVDKESTVDWNKVQTVGKVILIAAAVTAVALAVGYAASQNGGGSIRANGYYLSNGTYVQPRYWNAPDEYLGRFSSNQFAADSTSNPYGPYGSPYSSKSINNQYGTYGSQYSPQGAANRYTSGGAKLYGSNGQFLGNLNANPYDPNSVSNPYGQYGSKYSPTSVNNPNGQYGSPYSNQSANNQYATDAPVIKGHRS